MRLLINPILRDRRVLPRGKDQAGKRHKRGIRNFSPLFRLTCGLLHTLNLPIYIFRRRAGLITTNAVTMTTTNVNFFSTTTSLNRASVSLRITMTIISLLRVIRVRRRRRPTTTTRLDDTIRVTILVRRPNGNVRLIPRLTTMSGMRRQRRNGTRPYGIGLQRYRLGSNLGRRGRRREMSRHPTTILGFPHHSRNKR